MILKLGILIGILIIGGYVFSSQIQNLFPNASTDGVNSLKSDVKTLTTKSMQSAEDKIESSINQTQTKLVEIKDDSSSYIKNKIPFLNSTG